MDETQKPAKKPRRVKTAVGDALVLEHLNIGANWFDEGGMPKPWVLACVFTFHLLMAYFLANVAPIIMKKDEILPVEIVNLPRNEDVKQPIPQKFEEEVVQSRISQQDEIIPPTTPPKPLIEQQKPNSATIEKPLETEVEKPIEAIIPTKPVASIKLEIDKSPALRTKNQTNQIELNTKIIVRPSLDANEVKVDPAQTITISKALPNLNNVSKEVSKIEIPTQITAKPLDERIGEVEKVNSIRIEDQKKNIQFQSRQNTNINLPTKIEIPTDAPIAPNIDEQKRLEAARQQEIERRLQEMQKINSHKPAASAPMANGGEFSPPSSVTAIGGAPSAGNGLPKAGGPNVGGGANVGGASANPSQGINGGILPKRPPSYGSKGRNVFGNGDDDDGTLLGRVGNSLDCAKLGVKERKEKCPNWSPLEGNYGRIQIKEPPNIKKYEGPKNPLQPCPPGSPNSNLGLSCLPSKKPLTNRQ